MFPKVERVLRKYIIEMTTPVPRHLFDRWRAVQEAIELSGNEASDYKVVAAVATAVLDEKKMTTRGRKISEQERFSPEEVENLVASLEIKKVSLTQPEFLDVEQEDDNPEEGAAHNEVIMLVTRRLKELLQEGEWEVLSLR